jgi:hypothetical protein
MATVVGRDAPLATSQDGAGVETRIALVREGVLVALLWVATTAWVWIRMDQGWVPHDDGAFAQSAARVLQGELPHREFAELYTGGMTFLNAAAFWLLGEDLFSLRVPLFVLFLGFVPCVYYLARQFVGPAPAALSAIVAVTWGLPVYPAAVPSWYLLLFSVYGASALVRWRATGHARWLVVAGLYGGLAIVFKIVGVYYIVAVVYFLLVASPRVGERSAALGRSVAVTVAGSFVGVALLLGVLGRQIRFAELANFVLPVLVLTGALIYASWVGRSAPGARAQLSRISLFAVGVAVPVALFLIPFVWAGAIHELLRGVFVSPQSRREFAYFSTPLGVLLPASLVLTVIFVRRRVGEHGRNLLDAASVSLIGFVLVAAAVSPAAYTLLYDAGRGMAPLVVVAGGVALITSVRRGRDEPWELLFLILALVAFTALVQFPAGVPPYYAYLAPLVAVATVALAARLRLAHGLLPAALLVAYAIFGAAYLDRTTLNDLGHRYERNRDTVALADNASIRVTPETRRDLNRINDLVLKHGRGRYMYAGPDLPQLYFLTRFENPTRSLFDFLDTSDSARGRNLLRALRLHGVTVIAINLERDLSDPLEPMTLNALARLYPHHEEVGGIDVRWA